MPAGRGLGAVGIADDLREALAVAQIDEDDSAMVTAPLRPTTEGDDLPVEDGVELSAVMATHAASRKSQVE